MIDNFENITEIVPVHENAAEELLQSPGFKETLDSKVETMTTRAIDFINGDVNTEDTKFLRSDHGIYGDSAYLGKRDPVEADTFQRVVPYELYHQGVIDRLTERFEISEPTSVGNSTYDVDVRLLWNDNGQAFFLVERRTKGSSREDSLTSSPSEKTDLSVDSLPVLFIARDIERGSNKDLSGLNGVRLLQKIDASQITDPEFRASTEKARQLNALAMHEDGQPSIEGKNFDKTFNEDTVKTKKTVIQRFLGKVANR